MSCSSLSVYVWLCACAWYTVEFLWEHVLNDLCLWLEKKNTSTTFPVSIRYILPYLWRIFWALKIFFLPDLTSRFSRVRTLTQNLPSILEIYLTSISVLFCLVVGCSHLFSSIGYILQREFFFQSLSSFFWLWLYLCFWFVDCVRVKISIFGSVPGRLLYTDADLFCSQLEAGCMCACVRACVYVYSWVYSCL